MGFPFCNLESTLSMSNPAFFHQVFTLLLKEYGEQNWWPADTPFEVMLGAILTQNTSWTNVERAITALKEVCELTPAGILSLTLEQLQDAIRTSGYYRQKSLRVQGFCRFLMEEYGGDISRMDGIETGELRARLLSFKGVGPETADSILLYALNRPIFVVDTYTIRLFSRLGLCEEIVKYNQVQSLFMDKLEHDALMFNEYHALIVKHAKEKCRKRMPECVECPLAELCVFKFNIQDTNFRKRV